MFKECTLTLIYRLKSDEEVIGGFDLIFKNKEVSLPKGKQAPFNKHKQPDPLEPEP